MKHHQARRGNKTDVQRQDYHNTLLVMFGLGAATLTGFLRQAAIAHQLGAGSATDVYLVAFAVPEFVFSALPIVLSPTFIPLFATSRQQGGEAAAWRFGLRVAGTLLAVLFTFSLVAALGAPTYVRWLGPGLGPQERIQAARVTRLMLLGIGLMGLSTLAGATLQVYHRFARPALATAVYNLTFAVILLAAPLAQPLDRAAWGVTLGAAAALALQLPLLWKHRPSSPSAVPAKIANGYGNIVHPSPGFPQVAQVARLAGPLTAGYVVHHVILFVDRAMATTLGVGSAAVLSYAYRLALVVGQLSGLAVSTALFPRLAEQVAGDDTASARESLSAALRFVWIVGLPAVCGLILLRAPIVQVLFERGAFDRTATAAVSDPLVWYGLAVLADALCQPLWRVVYAQRSAWTMLAINGLQTGLRLLGNLALTPTLGYNGLALSAALGLSLQALVLGRLVRRWLGPYLPRSWWRDAARAAVATAVATAAASLLVAWLSGPSAIVILLVGGIAGGLAYLLTLRYTKYWKRTHRGDRTNGLPNDD
jgi:putative peptidoglycan lipid II flippase